MNWDIKRIKNLVGVVALMFVYSFASAQVAPEKYWIQFTDKDNSPYLVSAPIVYLSQRAIDRRTFHGVAVTPQDFPVNPSYVSGVEQAAMVNVLLRSRWMNGIVIQTTDTAGLAQIMALPFVDSLNSRSVESVEIQDKSMKMEISGDTFLYEEPSAKAPDALDYGLAQGQTEMIRINDIHDLGFTGNGIVIAVLDAGFRDADTLDILQNLWNNNQILGTWDFVTNQPVNFNAHSTHGRHVLNCMGANMPGKYIGTAPDASYWLLRTEDAPTENIIEEYNWVAGAEFADSAGADVFNTSLGYTTFDDSTYDHTYADLDGNTTIITRGADIAASKGILVVNSAGNSGGGFWHYIGAPADGDSVLAIGSVDASGIISGFSSRGPSSDGRTKPNVMAQGGAVPMPYGNDSAYYINGTSFSGPIIAGAAACLWQSRPGYTNMEIFRAIEESSSLSPGFNNDYGYGIPNFGLAYYLVTGVEDVKNSDLLESNGYPNPTDGMFNIPIQNEQLTNVTITNVAGIQMSDYTFSKTDNAIKIDVSNLAKGVYFVVVNSIESPLVYRVIKN